MVVQRRVCHFLQLRGRQEARLERTVPADELLTRGASGPRAKQRATGDDPALAAEGRDLAQRLRQVVGQLPPEDRALVEQLMAGVSLKAAARELGMLYHVAKQRRREVFAWLRRQLAGAE
jgi:hypothetical protein